MDAGARLKTMKTNKFFKELKTAELSGIFEDHNPKKLMELRKLHSMYAQNCLYSRSKILQKFAFALYPSPIKRNKTK